MRACALLKRIQSCAVHVALGQTSAPRQDDGNQLLRPGGHALASELAEALGCVITDAGFKGPEFGFQCV